MPMTPKLRFADLNIKHDINNESNTLKCVQRAIDMGYDCVAVNISMGHLSDNLDEANSPSSSDQPPTKKKKRGNKPSMKEIPLPYKVDETKLDTNRLTAEGKRFRQYTRITATVDRGDYLHAFLRHPRVLQYDLLALNPVTEQCLSTLAIKGETVDILTFELSEKTEWLYRGKVLNRAIDLVGLSIELSYSPALSDHEQRVLFFTIARQVLAQTRKAKGVILTSGATKPLELRGPYDAANLTALLDCPNEHARTMLSGNCERVLLRAESRKTVKGVFAVQPITNVNDNNLLDKLKTVPEFQEQMGEKTVESNDVIPNTSSA